MKLIIVESPSKAATIQKYVGDDYIVEATRGHIVDLGKGGTGGIGIDIEKGFKPFYVIMKDKLGTLDTLIQASEKVDEILLASDKDREGEAIAYHVQNRLETSGKPMSRVIFNEITKKGISDGLKNKRPINMSMFRAQESRRILDRIVGFMVSPFLINFYGPNLSAGRVQSVAVRMIVDREQEITSFKPEEFWNIFAKFSTPNKETFVAKCTAKPKNKEQADTLVQAIKEQAEFFVNRIVSQEKREKPCAPLTTASLQQYMAKKYSFEPDKTMKIAQTLYENGFCTYIRTDSTRTSAEAITAVRDWIKEKFDIPGKPNVYATKAAAQDAHECIRPTNIKNIPEDSILKGDEKDVYTAIWQHFVASQMCPAIWDTMQVSITASHNPKISFNISGKALKSPGYLEIFGDIDPGKIEIPNLQEQNIVVLTGDNAIKTEQKFTQPSPRYNDASIVKELETKQIGRPATYAEIIKKITARNYVEKQNNTYRPTELGKKITNILTNLFPFMEYKYTAELEKKLDDIESGDLEQLNMLKEFFIPFKEQLNKAYVSNGSTLCDKCGSPMTMRTNSKDQVKFMACSAFPICRNTQTIVVKD